MEDDDVIVGGESEAQDVAEERATQLPVSRVKAIARSDPEVTMINAEAVLLLTKATELFIKMISEAAHQQTQFAKPKRKTVQTKDIIDLVAYKEEYQFLHGIITASSTSD